MATNASAPKDKTVLNAIKASQDNGENIATNLKGVKAKTGTKAVNSTNPSKSEVKDKKLADLNIAKASKETVTTPNGKEPKYLYPEDCTTKDQKKDFRRKARAAMSSFDRAILKLKDSNDKKDKAEFAKLTKEISTWKKANLSKTKA